MVPGSLITPSGVFTVCVNLTGPPGGGGVSTVCANLPWPAHRVGMIDLDDLGLSPVRGAGVSGSAPNDSPDGRLEDAAGYDPALLPGSPGARALWNVWRGQPVVVVDSPPGAGKTTLVAAMVSLLVDESDVSVVVASPTVVGAEMLASRLAERLGDGRVHLSGGSFVRDIHGVVRDKDRRSSVPPSASNVVVRTVASCRLNPPMVDLLVIDEAYQVTFADASGSATQASQVLLVGDPGQIGPVTTVDVSPWASLDISPASRAPEGFARRSDAVVLHLERSFRLGADTVDAISPLYDFPFASARPEAWVDGYPELFGLKLPVSDQVASPDVMRSVVSHVGDLVGRDTMTHHGVLTLGADDVAVVAARNEQVAMLSALLRSDPRLVDVTVGTADSLQGGQWQAVVAVDPLLGAATASTHSLSLGRLCVMASRHVAHLTWASSPDYSDVIAAAVPDVKVGQAHRRVRQSLLGW